MIYVFPLETYARELPWRVHFACYILEYYPNAQVYIAETSKAVDIACMLGSNCVFIGKHIFSVVKKKEASYFYRLQKNGVKIIFVEEEGGLNLKGDCKLDSEIWKKRCPYDLIGIDSVTTVHWGEYQMYLTRELYGGSKSYHFVGGAPSIDSCIISSRVNSTELIYASSPEIAVMSNGGLGTIFTSIEDYYDFYLSRSDSISIFKAKSSYLASEIKLFQEMELIRSLIDDNHYEFRLHPGLAHLSPKHNSKYSLSNTTTVPINDFLDGKKLLVHDGCTTSVQAFFMDIPTISISSGHQVVSIGDYYPANERSKIYQDISDNGYSPLLNRNFELPKLFSDLIHNQKGKLNCFSTLIEICNILHLGDKEKIPTSSIDKYLQLRSISYCAKNQLRSIAHGKFSHFIPADIAKFIEQWQRYSNLEQRPSFKYHFRHIGVLAVKIWRS